MKMSAKKKVVLLSVLGIFLLIGTSYAIWQLNFTQDSSNTLSVACFSVTYSEQDNISLANTYPMLDSEGSSLTPYQVTIKNNCNEYGAYQVNLEVLNTTTLDSGKVKIMFDEGTPKLLTSYTAVEKTLSNATSAYKMTTGFLHPNEEKTYTLRLWLDENVTLEDHVEGKKFASKITIANTYKANAPTSQEECELIYGEGASICNFIAQADPNNDKCLKVDENGMILNPGSYMRDDEEPIVCTMEDDYGTSYYLRGNHQDNNVKFANMCWKLMRVTGTGGYKLIYNGDLDENGKCTTTSGEHSGFVGQVLPLSGSKVYGSSYSKNGNTYTLVNPSIMDWKYDSSSIIGKYTCGGIYTSCTSLYAVIGEHDLDQGYVLKLGQSTNYASIGISSFNSNSNSPAYVGYMYNDVYPTQDTLSRNPSPKVLDEIREETSNYYYGDTISYSNGDYYIRNQDGSDVVQLPWAENYQNNIVGKYTCKGSWKSGDKVLRCSTAYKVLDTTTKENYMISEYLTGGRISTGTIKLSMDYINNGDGTFTLKEPIIEKSALEWHMGDESILDAYVCDDWNQTTCTRIYRNSSTGVGPYIGGSVEAFNSYYYGESFTYNNGIYTLVNAIQVDDTPNPSLSTHHYTCFNAIDNTCSELYYIYNNSVNSITHYIKLNGNVTGPEALNKMVNNSDINVKDSTIKRAIDWWYEQTIKGTEYESYLEDTIFCNDREIDDLLGWGETLEIDGLATLKFNAANSKYYLKCSNKRDAFTVSDSEKGNASLIYPIGLSTNAEHSLMGNFTVNKTDQNYWVSAPIDFSINVSDGKYLYTNGSWSYHEGILSNTLGVRPSISLKPGTEFKEGTDGTAENPYEVVME